MPESGLARDISAASHERSLVSAPTEEELTEFKGAVLAKLALEVGKDASSATDRDWFVATAYAIRDRIIHRWLSAERESNAKGEKRVYYLSLEFLIGRLLSDVLCNLGLADIARAALGDLGVDPNRLRSAEPDAALGNGGLGRLAACFMESMASLGIPAYGYGIRYDHGLFRQVIKDGWQQEYPEDWLSFGNPWEFARPEVIYDIHFGGRVEAVHEPGRATRHEWLPDETIEAVAYDTPIVGWRGRNVNPLRLWTARAVDPVRLDAFNRGDHVGALVEQSRAEAISKVLYPSDETPAGRELRLRQEYFLVSASLQDLVKRHLRTDGNLHFLPQRAAIQLNDTHPSIAIAELMRLLVDVHGLPWADSWRITVGTFSYTNHTLLPEALETWSVHLFERVLPRHLQIIYHINAEHIETAKRKDPTGFADRLAAISLIDEQGGRKLRMGHLAFVGSHRVNGVSALHTGLMRDTVFHDLHTIYPDRIVNKTNGITFRRWLLQANPALTKVLCDVCGDAVPDDPSLIAKLADVTGDASVRERVAAAKRANKVAFSRLVSERVGLQLNPDALFDVQIKRIHEYKRQQLNILETVATYLAIRDDPTRNWVPRVKIFAGKAAASYAKAKLIIKLINDVAKVVNNDPVTRDLLRVVFLPDYNVSLAESIIPAADLSEQISTAGMEASGTGNMKLALNGALTIGTLDGANIEIREHVGADNIFIFGLKAHEVAERRRQGLDASATIAASPMLARTIDAIDAGIFWPGEGGLFAPLMHELQHHDYYMVTADFDDYARTQRRLDKLWMSPADWNRMCMMNIAHMAWFSSDRAIGEYAEDIWNVPFVTPAKAAGRNP
ncbi:MAG: glycogen/starch/alpha-glucan family phosphorylase [Rhizobiales bacterium]|nr:glycogen/starch/alpha-glucan family phosphorylase [Hyphomicrobiales bacterium]